ncbi:hypothetical protein [Enterococcus pallens]|uniref:Uncharacterized protein n=1 Tax=Enterococcus pallens ATCC BAA-351 TaxID=1158607 RepID=R2PQ71_9ENTE|nr:hypothetical protein [Enterococcus pallens]EOH86687.1 hypothetical protein UAU_05132 [Enterococcus pallens ATCC BAA-351]EOU18483.1 hypothetical protein I588_03477 [Enterococcus pallens ATCC BAA-351]
MACTSCGKKRSGGSVVGCCTLNSMDEQTPLEKIRNGDDEFCFIEITNAICESLKNDEGIHPSATHSNTDCEDLSALNDLAIARLHNALMVLNICDVDEYKCWLDSLVSWQWNVDKAIICAICGLWENIHDLWDEIEDLWKEIDKIWKEFALVWAAINAIISRINIIENDIKNIKQKIVNIETEINKLWNDSSSIWQNIGDIINVTNQLKDTDKSLQNQINAIKNKLPGGFSTLVTKEIWRGVGHAGNNLTLSESALNFDAIRVSFNVGGAQYSVDIQPGYLQHDAANVATYSGMDFSGTNKLEGSAGLKATNAAMDVLNVVPSKSNLVWTNLTNGNIDRFFQGTACNGQVGECIISRIEGVKKIDYA